MPLQSGKVKILHDIRIQTLNSENSETAKNSEWDDEERVFSDSEEENEYFRKIYSYDPKMINFCKPQELQKTLNIIPDNLPSSMQEPVVLVPSKCDQEIQCNIPIDKVQILEIVKVCAHLDTSNYQEFSELIKVCQNILNPYQDVNIDEKSNENVISSFGNDVETDLALNTQVKEISIGFVPSRQSLTSDFLSENLNKIKQVPSQPSPVKNDKNEGETEPNLNKLEFWKNRFSGTLDKKRRSFRNKLNNSTNDDKTNVNLKKLSGNSTNDNDKRINIRKTSTNNLNDNANANEMNDIVKNMKNNLDDMSDEICVKETSKLNLMDTIANIDVDFKKASTKTNETDVALRRSRRTGKPTNLFDVDTSLLKNHKKSKTKNLKSIKKSIQKANQRSSRNKILKELVDEGSIESFQFFKNSQQKSPLQNNINATNQIKNFIENMNFHKSDLMSDDVFKKPKDKCSRKTDLENNDFFKPVYNTSSIIYNPDNTQLNSNVLVRLSSSKQLSKKLARNWMKNQYGCVTDCKKDFINKSQDSGFTSFQTPKSRQLFSPSQWLNSIQLEHEERRSGSIFKK